MKRLLAGLGTLLTIVAALSPGAAWALTDEEIFRDFRFNFILPGARSLGLGGAFVAAADDATAAVANPAALHYIDQMEFFIEARAIRPDTQIIRPSQGTVGNVNTTIPFNTQPFFDPTMMPPGINPGNPDPFYLDMQSVTNREDQTLPSFVSFVFPFTLGARRATVGVSRQILLDVESTLTGDDNEPTSLRFANNDTQTWTNDGTLPCAAAEQGMDQFYSVCNTATGSLDAEIIHNNLSFSWSFHPDFSIGVTAIYATLDMNSLVNNVTQDPRGLFFSQNPRLDIGGGVLADVTTQTFTDGSDTDFTYTIGIHWHPDSAFPQDPLSPVKFGLVYRKGESFSVQERVVDVNPTTGQLTDLRMPFDNILRVPDRLALGFSYDLANHWTFSVDIENIEYSDLMEGFEPGVNFFTSQQLFTSFPETAVQNLQFDVDDAIVYHAGVEYFSFFRSGWGYALRAGYYNQPDNRIRMTGVQASDLSLPMSAQARVEEIYKDVFRGAEEVDHITGGFSFNTPIGLQLQVAGDFSDVGDQFVASFKYRFGKIR